MKTRIITLVAVIAIAIGGVALWHRSTQAPLLATDYKNATYSIEGKDISLISGYAETEVVPGSASNLVTQYFGNEATGDLTGSGLLDTAFLLTQDSGGSGTFYYLVAAIKVKAGYKGTNAIFLGDRIAPQTTEIKNRKIIVNYAERKPGEPMSAQPSAGVSKYFRVEDNRLTEIIGDR
ncbi:MAG: hypothetical protein NTW60_02625 [Candidatus Wolfebacteria bacterium]|nr:hypothetical protein [Candidatus Wolfebacteria bacterium]